MQLLSGWDKRIEKAKRAETKEKRYYARQVKFVDSVSDARDMAEFAQQRPLSHIGFDMEFRYDRPGVIIDKNHTAEDPKSIYPLLLSLALAEPTENGQGTLYCFVIDLRNPDLKPAIKEVSKLPVPFIGHAIKGDLFCLYQLGLPEPRTVWDTFIHEKALILGLNNPRYKLPPHPDVADEARAKEEAEENQRFSLSLVAACQRYGLPHAMAREKKRLQRSFLDHAKEAPFGQEQIEYAAEDAIAVACLYPHQVNRTVQVGLLQHLVTIEMPWVKTNAHMEWHGVRFDSDRRQQVLSSCERHLLTLQEALCEYGIENPRSHPQLKAFLDKQGLLPLFRRNGTYSFDRKQLALFRDRHPAIPLIRAIRRIHDLRSSQVVSEDFVGIDGRVHPFHRQLGTHTGRQTAKWPNILGVEGALRPLIVPEAGCGIGEVDWVQIEVGVAAAVYDDARLIEMYNTEDVYSAMAQDFYRTELPAEELGMSTSEFKRKHLDKRERMKTCTLGIIYGMTAHGLALRLGTGKAEAAVVQSRFMNTFPQLEQALSRYSSFGGIRGYATTVTGLRRHRARKGIPSGWERNWFTNHPVQGSAAVIFKAAGNRLDRLYQQYDAHLIVPLHDAFVFEAPLGVLDEVAKLTESVMCETVQEFFPELRSKAEINIERPDCWNKDGDAHALQRWLEDPMAEVLR